MNKNTIPRSYEGHEKLLALPDDKNKWVLGGPLNRQKLQKELQPGILNRI